MVHLIENMNQLKLLSTYYVPLIVLGAGANKIVIKSITSGPHKQILYVKGGKEYTHKSSIVCEFKRGRT